MLCVLTYDQRVQHHNYQPLYDLLNSWGAVHMQNSVWLANMNGSAVAIRDAMIAAMHPDDTASVLELKAGSGWATKNTKPGAAAWLRQKVLA